MLSITSIAQCTLDRLTTQPPLRATAPGAAYASCDQAQPYIQIQSVHRLVVGRPALAAQQRVQLLVSVARTHRRRLIQAPAEGILGRPPRPIDHRRTIEPAGGTGATLEYLMRRLGPDSPAAPISRRQNSLNGCCWMCWSGITPATGCSSLRFSSRNWCSSLRSGA